MLRPLRRVSVEACSPTKEVRRSGGRCGRRCVGISATARLYGEELAHTRVPRMTEGERPPDEYRIGHLKLRLINVLGVMVVIGHPSLRAHIVLLCILSLFQKRHRDREFFQQVVFCIASLAPQPRTAGRSLLPARCNGLVLAIGGYISQRGSGAVGEQGEEAKRVQKAARKALLPVFTLNQPRVVKVYCDAVSTRGDGVVEAVEDQTREGHLRRHAVRDEHAVHSFAAVDKAGIDSIVHLVHRVEPLQHILLQRL
mmetsp:Transcript_36390/g.95681  ORF Transcript_36390/g.95681 Transcript_36390/m.95681 type:complete len:255 (-) Transcript_36390:285-1049(-)